MMNQTAIEAELAAAARGGEAALFDEAAFAAAAAKEERRRRRRGVFWLISFGLSVATFWGALLAAHLQR